MKKQKEHAAVYIESGTMATMLIDKKTIQPTRIKGPEGTAQLIEFTKGRVAHIQNVQTRNGFRLCLPEKSKNTFYKTRGEKDSYITVSINGKICNIPSNAVHSFH